MGGGKQGATSCSIDMLRSAPCENGKTAVVAFVCAKLLLDATTTVTLSNLRAKVGWLACS